MAKRVIVIVSDNDYVNHTKSMISNCREQGCYTDDFAIICPIGSKAMMEFRRCGFDVLEVESKGFLQKFSVFDKFFKRWEQCLYVDCDIVIQDNLDRLFHLLEVDGSKIWCDTEDCSTLQSFWKDPLKEQHSEIYELMQEKFPHVNNQTFNSAFILFKPSILGDDIPEQLMAIQEMVEPTNRQGEWGTDQQICNLLLWHQMKKIPNKLVAFWGLAEPQNDMDSEYRQYKKGDIPVAIHFSRWYSHWIDKTSNMDAYWNHRLNKPNHDIYKENLELFYKNYP